MSSTKDKWTVIERVKQLGITERDALALRRIALTLHNWHEKECGTDYGCIERDETTGKAYWLNSTTMSRYPVRDMEKGAIARLEQIMARYEGITPYIQTDPRGVSLHLLSQATIAHYDHKPLEQIYSQGVALY